MFESDLYKEPGDGNRIHSDLTEKLKYVSKILMCTYANLSRLNELLRVCKIIKFNLNLAGRLQTFNFDAWLRQIFDIFPPKMLTQWKNKVSSTKANHETLNYDELSSLMKDSIVEISATEPLYKLLEGDLQMHAFCYYRPSR